VRYFTPDYVERAVLADGTAIVLRLVAPDDKQLLRDGFERWSPESRYSRFLAPKTTLTDDELQYLTEIDQEQHFALGAIRESDGRGLGVARFIALPDEAGVAEAAIAVADDAQGKGLGKLLFLRLCAAAGERGIGWFRCEVLGSNTAMVRLLEQIAPDRTIRVSEGVITIDLVLPAVAPRAAEHPAPRSPMYRLFRAAAENAVEWTERVRRLWRR
jgi:GNAT superfamily N-acetyltransferase